MKKIVLLIVIPFYFYIVCPAQIPQKSTLPNFVVSFEFSTWFLSEFQILNVEGLIHKSDTNEFSLYGKIGLTKGFIMPVFCSRDNFTGKILGLTLVHGSGNNHFEANIGAFFISETELENTNSFFNCYPRTKNILPLIDFGYRYQKPEGGLVYRAKIGVSGLGVGLGYAF